VDVSRADRDEVEVDGDSGMAGLLRSRTALRLVEGAVRGVLERVRFPSTSLLALGVLGALSRDDDEDGDIGARGEVVACAAAFDEEAVDDEVVLASLSMSPLAPPFRPADPVLIERERDDIFPCPLSASGPQVAFLLFLQPLH
jgi:hypothetical protein